MSETTAPQPDPVGYGLFKGLSACPVRDPDALYANLLRAATTASILLPHSNHLVSRMRESWMVALACELGTNEDMATNPLLTYDQQRSLRLIINSIKTKLQTEFNRDPGATNLFNAIHAGQMP